MNLKVMRKIICYVFGHKYKVLRRITNTIRELKCERCRKEFAMNDDVRCVLPLSIDLKEANDYMLEK